jgi:hypothetical protein
MFVNRALLTSNPAGARHYVVLIVFLFVVPSLLFVSFQDVLGAFALNWQISPATYPDVIRNSDIGCRTLRMRRPDIVFIGDSHSYAGWDFGEIERATGQRVGGCLLGGLYLESIPDVLSAMETLPVRPKKVVLGLSPRMFWDSTTRAQQTAANLDVIKEIRDGRFPTFALRRQILEQTGEEPADGLEIERHRQMIAAIPNDNIETKLDSEADRIPDYVWWRERLKDIRIVDQARATIARICRLVSEQGLRLYVVHMPESPYLEAKYPPGMWDDYIGMAGELRACAAEVSMRTTAEYGLDNHDYLDRFLSNTGYDQWLSNRPLRNGYEFDLDHLNRFGARQFTRQFLKHSTLSQP